MLATVRFNLNRMRAALKLFTSSSFWCACQHDLPPVPDDGSTTPLGGSETNTDLNTDTSSGSSTDTDTENGCTDSNTNGGGDSELDSVPCMRRYEAGCPTPSNLGSFTATKLPLEEWGVDYDTQCEVVSSNMDGPTVIELECDVPDNQTWSQHTIQIDVEPKWTPPALGTLVRFRRYRRYDDTGLGNWHVWRLDLLDSGILIAMMMEDHSQGNFIEWAPRVEVIWDGCVDTCGVLHDLWVRVTLGCGVTTMFSGDQCAIDDYEIWLKTAQGMDCDKTGGGYRALDVLILKANSA